MYYIDLFYVEKKFRLLMFLEVTSESPFLYHQAVEKTWEQHCVQNNDATFFDDIIDGCGFELIKLSALKKSHQLGNKKHRSELCTLYIREHLNDFKVEKIKAAAPSIEKRFKTNCR